MDLIRINLLDQKIKYIARNRKWNRNNPQRRKHLAWRGNIKAKYGLSEEAYLSILVAQKGACKLCGEVYENRRLAVDHNHKTGRIRGLLCWACNAKVAWAENRWDTLNEYLS